MDIEFRLASEYKLYSIDPLYFRDLATTSFKECQSVSSSSKNIWALDSLLLSTLVTTPWNLHRRGCFGMILLFCHRPGHPNSHKVAQHTVKTKRQNWKFPVACWQQKVIGYWNAGAHKNSMRICVPHSESVHNYHLLIHFLPLPVL